MGCICSKELDGDKKTDRKQVNATAPVNIDKDGGSNRGNRVASSSSRVHHQSNASNYSGSFAGGSSSTSSSRQLSKVSSSQPNYSGSLSSKASQPSYSGSLSSKASQPNHSGSLTSKASQSNYSGSLTSRASQPNYSGSLTSRASQPNYSGSLISKASQANYSGSLASKVQPQAQQSSLLDEGGLVGTMTIIVERPSVRRGSNHHQRRATVDLTVNGGGGRQMESSKLMNRIVSLPRGPEGEQVAAGWPSWLTSVAGEAIQGWLPRKANSFERLEKIGQGTYSSVYKARDLETGKLVAMKKVRFVNMDPESVRFMAREILILRKLDHPNVIKLEGLVASKKSSSMYLVFEYMEHDLSGLSATPGINFTEPQIKCYMQQLLCGLEHCHGRGVLHRDIKGSNLLINNDGVLKIGDFGLATFFSPQQKQPLTSRVVTLWYRAPELLLGSTDYGIAVDMWSVGCILAELLAGKPIMPGRTEVEQMHKIFKLCGSPSEDYWRKSRLPHATSFKSQQPYRRRVVDAFKDFPPSALVLVDHLLAIEPEHRGSASTALNSEFFKTNPAPCDPSSLPKYPPSKELDIKFRDETARRHREEAVKGRGPEYVTRGYRESKVAPTPESDVNGEILPEGQSNHKSNGINPQSNGMVAAFTVDTHNRNLANGVPQCSSMIHPSAVGLGSSWTNKVKEDEDGARQTTGRAFRSRNAALDLRTQTTRDDWMSNMESSSVYVPKKNRMHHSGPLVPPGGTLEDMLKEHERQIQQAVRKSKARNKHKNGDDEGDQSQSLQYHGKNVW